MDKQRILVLFTEGGIVWVSLYFSERIEARLNRYEPEAWRSVLSVTEKARRQAT